MYQNKIKQYRLEQKMTLKILAGKAGISAGYLCHLEKGTRVNPSTKLMENIARELGKTVSEVFFAND